MGKLEKADVEYMLENGVGSYLKSYFGLIRDTILTNFSNINFASLFHKIYVKVKSLVASIAKFYLFYYIATKIYESIGTEKFALLLIAAYITQSVAKKEEGTS